VEFDFMLSGCQLRLQKLQVLAIQGSFCSCPFRQLLREFQPGETHE
jgi:hypothetical protein